MVFIVLLDSESLLVSEISLVLLHITFTAKRLLRLLVIGIQSWCIRIFLIPKLAMRISNHCSTICHDLVKVFGLPRCEVLLCTMRSASTLERKGSGLNVVTTQLLVASFQLVASTFTLICVSFRGHTIIFLEEICPKPYLSQLQSRNILWHQRLFEPSDMVLVLSSHILESSSSYSQIAIFVHIRVDNVKWSFWIHRVGVSLQHVSFKLLIGNI